MPGELAPGTAGPMSVPANTATTPNPTPAVSSERLPSERRSATQWAVLSCLAMRCTRRKERSAAAYSATAQPRPRGAPSSAVNKNRVLAGRVASKGTHSRNAAQSATYAISQSARQLARTNPRATGAGAADVLVEHPCVAEVEAHRRPGGARGQPGHRGGPVGRPGDEDGCADRHQHGRDRQRQAAASHRPGSQVGGDGVGGQRPQPATAVEEASHAEHGREGDREEQCLGRERQRSPRGHRVAPTVARPRRVEVRTWAFHAVAKGWSRVTRSTGTSGGGPTAAPGSQAERSMWTIVREP